VGFVIAGVCGVCVLIAKWYLSGLLTNSLTNSLMTKWSMGGVSL